MAAVVNVNGRIAGERDAVISVFDHGFLYGDGVYETCRTYNGRPFLFDRHLRRLRVSAERIRLRLPLSDNELLARIFDTMAAASLPGEAYVRLLVTRGIGDLSYDPTVCPEPSVVIIVKPLVEPPPEAFERGVRIVLVSILRNHPGALDPLIKSNNLLNNALAMQEALRHGGYEALMRNYRGELAECSQSNFFLVRDGVVLTPSLDAGLLDGITRDVILEIGPEAGTPVRETVILESDLDTADEAFITSTTRELLPVVLVDERVIGAGVPGPITFTLLQAYRRRAHELTQRPVASRVGQGTTQTGNRRTG